MTNGNLHAPFHLEERQTSNGMVERCLYPLSVEPINEDLQLLSLVFIGKAEISRVRRVDFLALSSHLCPPSRLQKEKEKNIMSSNSKYIFKKSSLKDRQPTSKVDNGIA